VGQSVGQTTGVVELDIECSQVGSSVRNGATYLINASIQARATMSAAEGPHVLSLIVPSRDGKILSLRQVIPVLPLAEELTPEHIGSRIAYVTRWRIEETDMRTWEMRLAVPAERSDRDLRRITELFHLPVMSTVHDVDDRDHKDDEHVTVWLVGVVVNGKVQLEARDVPPMPKPPTFVDGGPYPLGPDDPSGGTRVREPRRPSPNPGSSSVAADD
jgi:hypothetical protein